ncbi:MAG TPA: MarR family transcriptional regulator [Mycobacteriales bacterium]|nr:MarR family transcriptional regulator [Mycobacteriales bacterium]
MIESSWPSPGMVRFVDRFSSALVEGGVPRMPAKVFSLLLATDSGRLTAAELAEQLQASPAAISGAVRYLIQVDLISRGRDPGSRRDHYQVEDDLWHEAISSRDNLLVRWESSLREGLDLLGPKSPAGARIAETIAFFEFVQKEIPEMMERWRERRAELRAQRGTDGSGR